MSRVSRRSFLAASAAATFAAPAFVRGRHLNGKIRIAAIGSGGRGGHNLSQVAGETDVTVLCDVNGKNLDAAAAKYAGAAKFTDFRKLYDEAHKQFDAVRVSTCEHTPAIAPVAAISL